MATKTDIELARVNIFLTFGFAFMAVGVALLAIPAANKLLAAIIALLGVFVSGASYFWIFKKIKPDK
jgi:hypothetical protein